MALYCVLYFVFERLWKCVWSFGLDDWLADLTESKRRDKWKPWQNKQEKHRAHSSVTPQSHSFSFHFMKTFMSAPPKCISVSLPKYVIIKFGHPSIIIIFPMLSHVYSHQKWISTHLFIIFFCMFCFSKQPVSIMWEVRGTFYPFLMYFVRPAMHPVLKSLQKHHYYVHILSHWVIIKYLILQ